MSPYLMRSRALTAVVFLALFLAKSAYSQTRYYLPQFADGGYGSGSYKTTFILFNNSNVDATASLKLTNDNGNPLTVAIVGIGTDSIFNIVLPGGSTRILQTDGSGNLVTGAATVTISAVGITTNIGVTAIFTIYDVNGRIVTESGVGSSDPSSSFVIPVDTIGLYNTGLALFNIGNGDAAITIALIGTDGKEIIRTARTLSNNAHTACFVAGSGQLFPSISNFRGTLAVQSSIPITAMVLRQYENPLSYTSLPVVPRSANKLTLNLAQVANGSFVGGSYKSSFLIFNISATTAKGVLSLTKDDGSPLAVTIPNVGTSSAFNFSLAAGASVFVQTDGSGLLTTGSATLTSNVPIGASAIFTVFDSQGNFQTEAAVGDSPVSTQFTLPVDITGSFDTGVAFFNPGTPSGTFTSWLLDGNGVPASQTVTRTIAGRSHLAIFASQLFPGTSNFRGSLVVTATTEIAALTLRQNSSPLSYTTLPVASGIPVTTIFMIHGLSQYGGAEVPVDDSINGLATSLKDPIFGIDQRRYQIDAGFDYGSCADAIFCDSTACTIENIGRQLAAYINSKNPSGNIVLMGYSLGGLVARDTMLNNYSNVFGNRHVMGLITLGTPNLGYPYSWLDNLVKCSPLIQQMDGDLSQGTADLSTYLSNLTNSWGFTSFVGQPKRWLALSGRSCDNPWRALTLKGCPSSNPFSDGVVCETSSAFRVNVQLNRPTDIWSDPSRRYSHTGSLGTILILCDGSGFIPLYNPPASSDLIKVLKEFINGL